MGNCSSFPSLYAALLLQNLMSANSMELHAKYHEKSLGHTEMCVCGGHRLSIPFSLPICKSNNLIFLLIYNKQGLHVLVHEPNQHNMKSFDLMVAFVELIRLHVE